MLTIKQLDALKPRSKQYKVYDMEGLYIVVTPRSIKSFRYNYKDAKGYQTKTYGLYPDISLSKARLLNAEFKDSQALVRLNGVVASKIKTFREFVEQDWYKFHLPALSSPKHKSIIQSSMTQYVFEHIGDKPINQITRKELVSLVKGIQDTGVIETANIIAGRLGQIFTHAVNCDEMSSM
ncbi:MAG: integrase arm-type DNA-binding domain-containing protein [Methylophilaceae bacterium]